MLSVLSLAVFSHSPTSNEASRCLDQCFQWCSTVCFECLQMIHITSWSCYSFRTQTEIRESRSAVEIQQFKKEHDWTCSCSRKNNRILGCNETESSRTNIFISLAIPLYLNNSSWWMILGLRNLLIFLSRRIKITLNKNNVKLRTNIYLEKNPELGEKYDVNIYYSSQTSLKISKFMDFQSKLIQHYYYTINLFRSNYSSWPSINVIDKAKGTGLWTEDSTVKMVRRDLCISQQILSAQLLSEKMLYYFCLLIYSRYC